MSSIDVWRAGSDGDDNNLPPMGNSEPVCECWDEGGSFEMLQEQQQTVSRYFTQHFRIWFGCHCGAQLVRKLAC